MLRAQIDADIKSALLAGDREKADILRFLKSAILNEEVAKQKRDEGLSDAEIEQLVARESKKRDEAAEMFAKGGNAESAAKERFEKEILSGYLPKQLTDEELAQIVEDAVQEAGEGAQMGKIIGAVKQKVGNQAEGARVAALVQKALK